MLIALWHGSKSSLPPLFSSSGVRGWLRLLIVALPGLFFYYFYMNYVCMTYCSTRGIQIPYTPVCNFFKNRFFLIEVIYVVKLLNAPCIFTIIMMKYIFFFFYLKNTHECLSVMVKYESYISLRTSATCQSVLQEHWTFCSWFLRKCSFSSWKVYY